MKGLKHYLRIKNNSLINYPTQPVYNIKKKLFFAIYTPIIFNFKLTALTVKNSDTFIFILKNKTFTSVFYISKLVTFLVKSSSILFFINIFDNNIYKYLLKNFFLIFVNTKYFYFNIIKYSGKAYRIIKKKKTLWLLFHFSHCSIFFFSYFKKFKFKRKKKKLIFFSKFPKKLHDPFVDLINLRKSNIFTKRGVRFKQQLLFKKTGKISTYVI